MAWPGNRVQEMVIAKLLLRLSLNNPSNVCHCSKEICHKNDREREREKRERASWMPMDMAIPLQCFVRISDKKLLHYYSGLLSPFTIVFWIQSNVPILKPSSLRSLNIDSHGKTAIMYRKLTVQSLSSPSPQPWRRNSWHLPVRQKGNWVGNLWE